MQINVMKSTRRNAIEPKTMANISEVGEIEVLLVPGVPFLFVLGLSDGANKALVNVPLTAWVCVTVAPRASVVAISTVDTPDGDVEDTRSRRAEAEFVISGSPEEVASCAAAWGVKLIA
jgi:hypothetical protein